MTRPKNKTLATWLTFLGGPLGLHRFYLKGFGDLLGWMLPIPTALGLYGVERVQRFGQDVGRILVYILFGIIIGSLVLFRKAPVKPHGPLSVELIERATCARERGVDAAGRAHSRPQN